MSVRVRVATCVCMPVRMRVTRCACTPVRVHVRVAIDSLVSLMSTHRTTRLSNTLRLQRPLLCTNETGYPTWFTRPTHSEQKRRGS
jgi:hypothetical protein